MRNGWLYAVMLLFFILEGTVAQVFAPDAWGASWIVVPRFTLAGIVLIGLYAGRRKGLIFGLFFGLLYDVLYAQVIGVEVFTMGVMGYLAGLTSRYFHQNFILAVVDVIVLTALHEWITYEIYDLFNLASMSLLNLFMREILPTVVCSALFTLIVFRPFSYILNRTLLKKEIV
ncbi:rod shape-determining protein MreD [Aneurinibacillus soli]|uniref:Rod shape-determining protein MreD n=1 Tax=Aneurinibacillus soli TaxID=1500254 RepID=A0A0U5B5N2_9BACL|nr:rod shape-determining protein MreD [Aneurinibacillus soli]PYE62435.1 rod shape-determining protein MreD [Aneurinibacillus soli]BAU26998.1 Rod shape-determining protein MreD [Aneurinibacillus soli]